MNITTALDFHLTFEKCYLQKQSCMTYINVTSDDDLLRGSPECRCVKYLIIVSNMKRRSSIFSVSINRATGKLFFEVYSANLHL